MDLDIIPDRPTNHFRELLSTILLGSLRFRHASRCTNLPDKVHDPSTQLCCNVILSSSIQVLSVILFIIYEGRRGYE